MDVERDYGDAIARSFGLGGAPSVIAQPLQSSRISISKLSIGPDQFGMSARIPAEDSFVLALYLTDVPHHELWSGGRIFLAQGYKSGSIRIVNLTDEFSANISHAHESLAFYVPRMTLNEFAREHGKTPITDLACEPGIHDPVVAHLAAAILPSIEQPGTSHSLFVDYVALALCAHLSRAYGGLHDIPEKGGLSRVQARRAMDFMASHCGDDFTLSDVAKECGLSRGYFAQAFKISTGTTPHQWLQRYRINKAQSLLIASEQSVADIAIICGFADQSHLTRVFTKLAGKSPAAWRRASRS